MVKFKGTDLGTGGNGCVGSRRRHPLFRFNSLIHFSLLLQAVGPLT